MTRAAFQKGNFNLFPIVKGDYLRIEAGAGHGTRDMEHVAGELRGNYIGHIHAKVQAMLCLGEDRRATLVPPPFVLTFSTPACPVLRPGWRLPPLSSSWLSLAYIKYCPSPTFPEIIPVIVGNLKILFCVKYNLFYKVSKKVFANVGFSV